ncbi:tail fiber protein [Bradyrhizobium tropiciagri]|uniref:phage tail protein n=1 Tax=Bradyrhizobium tropiciagri TaxID=312253 RepID=UPI001BA5862F|nr:tail fiber protein [Bradyrhizobium tropiciagri]MBR0899960.1 tail fiber protein [Bradyrhizobium tropiciagri]
MALETFSYITSLDSTNPAPTDGVVNGDDHMRGIKLTLKQTFPGATGPLTTVKGGHQSIDDGTAAAPAFTFTSEPTLGFYRSAAGTIACSGTLIGSKAIGEVFDFAGTTPPVGSVVCDGQALSRTAYAALFQAIGTTWGAGDGSTTFNVPNLQDRYRRHRSGSAAGAVGTLQADAVKPHTHVVNGSTGAESAAHSHSFSGTTNGTSTGGAFSAHLPNSRIYGSIQTSVNSAVIVGIQMNNGDDGTINVSGNMEHTHSFSGTTATESANHSHAFSVTSQANTGDSETRPLSATMLTCIRVQ